MNRPVRIQTCVAVTLAAVVTLSAATDNLGSIDKSDLKGWLSYIASDELEGRGLYSAGLGLAAAYIENHLRKIAGDGIHRAGGRCRHECGIGHDAAVPGIQRGHGGLPAPAP